MARRTSSRAASHDQASSPPKPDASRRSVRSPQKRSTRATRSQSRDLDEPHAPSLRQASRRNERQHSVDSVGSDVDAAKNGRGKNVRGNAPIQPELSMVAEDEEMQGSLENEEDARGFPNIQQLPVPIPSLPEMPQSAPPTKTLLPAAQIHSTSRGNSLFRGLSSVKYLFGKTPQVNAAPPSNQQQLQQQVATGPSAPKTPQNNATRELPSTAPAKTSQEGPTQYGDGQGYKQRDVMVDIMFRSDAEKNKENTPLPTEATTQPSAAAVPAIPQRKSFIERQPNAQRVPQISDSDGDSQPEPAVRQYAKRAREEPEELPEDEIPAPVDEDEISGDDAFEQDRERLPSRFRDPPPEPEVIQLTGGPRKRARIPSRVVSHGPTGVSQSRQPRVGATASRLQQQPSSSRVHGSTAVVSPAEEELRDGMRNYREAQQNASLYQTDIQQQAVEKQPSLHQSARQMVAQQSQASGMNGGAHRPTQTRTKWSEEEVDGFLDLIARYGTSWAKLYAIGVRDEIFDDCRNQVSLKDKARNLKVDFLIARAPLPRNFDYVALSKKEVDKVLARGANPYRKEGEMVGQEAIDMEGNPRSVFDD
ncbi:hypothetical protein V492_02382 [Pseudogymnoascus sp. VKM F-4246]|nr:hypothetical protein V492_02382 [Pseudogymnoascus sp. VKM F-4246]